MNFLPERGYKRVLCIAAYILAGAAALYAFSKYVLPLFLPFIIAWLIAALLQKPVVFAEKKLRIPKKLAAFVIVTVFLGAASVIIFALVSALIRQGGEFLGKISENMQSITDGANEIFDKIENFLGKFGIKNGGDVRGMISNALTSAVGALTSKATGVAAKFASSLPRALIFFAAMILSCVYFCADYRKIANFLLSALPKRAARAVSTLKKEFSAVMKKYFRSYALIFILTFGELFLGLSILGTGNEVIIAFIIAFVDVLPVIGAGAALVPWAVVNFLLGDAESGIFILVMYGIISIVRQVVEPHIVGRGIGLHPAVSIISMYVGLCTFGVGGMIFMPLAVAVLKNTAQTFIGEKK